MWNFRQSSVHIPIQLYIQVPSNSILRGYSHDFWPKGLICVKPFHDFVSSTSQANMFWLVQKVSYTIPSTVAQSLVFRLHSKAISCREMINLWSLEPIILLSLSIFSWNPWVKPISADIILNPVPSVATQHGSRVLCARRPWAIPTAARCRKSSAFERHILPERW